MRELRSYGSRSAKSSMVLALMAMLFAWLSLAAWALSSPAGSAPDDDYHLSSIWCPIGETGGDCDRQTIAGGDGSELTSVVVPESVSHSAICYAFNAGESAACTEQYSDIDETATNRVDAGNYPGGFYTFFNLFVGHDVSHSVIVMRLVNSAITVLMLAVTALVIPTAMRWKLLAAVSVAWVPVGMFFLASTNPTSWALTGIIVEFVSLVGLMRSSGWRRIALAVSAMFGAVLASVARGDAAAFSVLIVLFAWFLVGNRPQKDRLVEIIVSIFISIFGTLMFLRSGQSGAIDMNSPDNTGMTPAQLVFSNLLQFGSIIGGFNGVNWGLGWIDTMVPLSAAFGMTMLVGGVLYAGLRAGTGRKWITIALIFGAIVGMGLFMLWEFKSLVGAQVQPRYLLPLWAVLIFAALHSEEGSADPLSLSRPQWLALVLVVSLSNSLSLHANTRRYVTGTDVAGWNLNDGAEWWSNGVVGPMANWLMGSISLLLMLVIVMQLSLQGTSVSRVRAAEPGRLNQPESL